MAVLERFLREMKASPPKAVALAVLTCVGLYFWIPPVWSTISGDHDAPHAGDATGVVGATETVSGSVSASPTQTEATSTSGPTAKRSLHWDELEQIRQTDVLYQSAMPAEIKLDAFVAQTQAPAADAEQLAASTSATEEKEEEAFSTEEHAPQDESASQLRLAEVAQQLKLRSIMIGPTRRAAVINNRVYLEGEPVLAGGRRARVSSVEARRVTVELDGERVELRIDPFASSQVQLEQ